MNLLPKPIVSIKKILILLLISAVSFLAINVAHPSISYAGTRVTCPDGYDTSLNGDQTFKEVCNNHTTESGMVCPDKNDRLLGILPKWYKYVPYYKVNDRCTVNIDFSANGFNALLPIGLAVIEIMLSIAGLVTVGFIIYGGFQYVISQGEPDRTKSALSTIINAFIGGVIAVVASAIVAFIGNRLG